MCVYVYAQGLQHFATVLESKDAVRMMEFAQDLQAAGEKKKPPMQQQVDKVTKSGTLSEQVMRIRMAWMKPVLRITGVGKERAPEAHPGPPY
jgi:hypothetical protein